jgi:hypothetical protein
MSNLKGGGRYHEGASTFSFSFGGENCGHYVAVFWVGKEGGMLRVHEMLL